MQEVRGGSGDSRSELDVIICLYNVRLVLSIFSPDFPVRLEDLSDVSAPGDSLLVCLHNHQNEQASVQRSRATR